MKIRGRRFAGAALLSLGVATAAAPLSAAEAAPHLLPHRAVYDMTLDRTSAGSGVIDLNGRMVYELKRNACKGYIQTIRFVTRTSSPKGRQTLMDVRSLYREAADADNFNFQTRQLQNDRQIEETVGVARRADANVAVRLTKPIAKRLSLDNEVLFPIQHTRRILSAAQAGKRIFASALYDGSDKGLKVYDTIAVIGEPEAAKPDKKTTDKIGTSLDGVKAWPVSLSYFVKGKTPGDSVPEYELSFQFLENGVSRRLFIDYGSFAIRANLVKLEMLKPEKCARQQ